MSGFCPQPIITILTKLPKWAFMLLERIKYRDYRRGQRSFFYKKYGLDNVILEGTIDTALRSEYYRQSDLFVLPSKYVISRFM